MSLADYAALVRMERQRRGWSQRELAQRAHTNPASVSRFEAGADVQAGTLIALFEALGLTLNDCRICGHEFVCRRCGQTAPQ